ncbi:MAG: serine--tRNA ligase, partial [Thermoleophilaceae bacterium]
MLDLRQIRADPEPARAALARRGFDAALLDQALELDERRRAILPELEDVRRGKNEASKRIGELKRAGEDASEAIEVVGWVSARERELDEELREV